MKIINISRMCLFGLWCISGQMHAQESIFTQVYNVPARVYKTIKQSIKDRLKISFEEYIKSDPYINVQAKVRTGIELCPEEKTFLVARAPIVTGALSRLEIPVYPRIPKIAIIASGGGMRAFLGTIGFLNGLHRSGLLNTASYVVGLSGSSWAICYWIMHKKWLEETVSQAIITATRGFKGINAERYSQFLEAFSIKWAFDQPVSEVDIYGALLADALFSSYAYKTQKLRLSYMAKFIQNGEYPFPIFTAISTHSSQAGKWYEFTPYEIGATWLQAFVPTWGFGRKFNQGVSITTSPEMSLGYLMGIWGSVFTAKFEQIYDQSLKYTITNPILLSRIEKMLKESSQRRFFVPYVFNFTQGIPESPLAQEPLLGMVDAATLPGFNIAYPPISGERPDRCADVIIVLDSSHIRYGNDPVGAMVRYAQEHNLSLPPISSEQVYENTVSVFQHSDGRGPLVIIVRLHQDKNLWEQYKNDPRFSEYRSLNTFDYQACLNSGSCQTMNLTYKLKDAVSVTELAEFNVRVNEDLIKNRIRSFWTLLLQREAGSSQSKPTTKNARRTFRKATSS